MKRLISAEKGEDDDEIPAEPPPLKTPDVIYALQTWMHFRMHHVYPEAGGYNDQDADLMDDWSTLNLWYIRLQKGVEAYAVDESLEFMNVRAMMHD